MLKMLMNAKYQPEKNVELLGDTRNLIHYDPEAILERKEFIEKVVAPCLSRINIAGDNERNKEIFMDYMAYGNYSQVGKKHGLSCQSIRRIVEEGCRIIRMKASKYYGIKFDELSNMRFESN